MIYDKTRLPDFKFSFFSEYYEIKKPPLKKRRLLIIIKGMITN